MSDKIVLFDLPTKGRCACFSPNVWKTRLVLNYKNIPYRTEWIERDNIAPKLKQLGVEPGAGNRFGSPYTVPAIVLPDGTPVMDSMTIASTLESKYPEPSLHMDTGLQDEFEKRSGAMMKPLIPVFMPRIPRDMLPEASIESFNASRKKAFGMTLDELEQKKGGEPAWEAARPGIEDVGRLLREHKRDEGPFVLGSQVSYVDFMIVATMKNFARIGNDLYEKLVSYDENFRKLYEACEEWMKSDQ